MKKNLHIVILAAGLSQRLGFPKQLILKNGITLLEEKIRLALAFSNNVSVVIPDIDTLWAKQIFAVCQLFPVQIVVNPTPQTGMAQSIQLAFTTLNEQKLSEKARVVFLTLDQIALTALHLTQLIQAVDSQTIIACHYGKPKIVGIPVNIPFGFLAEFVPQLQGDKGFGKILNTLSQMTTGYQVLPITMPELGWDIDTPMDWTALQAKFALQPPIYI